MSWTCRSVVGTVQLILLVLLLAACDNPTDSNEPSWNLIWQDEFNGPANQASQSSKWGYDIGTNWGNDQLEYDTDRTSNVSLDGNGYLAIVARKENYLGQEYTSARIVTRDLFEPTYGRFEARIKLPIGQGIWPAFWMLGANIETVGWPQCGEIDIMEYLGQEPNIVHGSLHGPGYSGGQPITRSMSLGNGRFSDGFHVFAIEWRSNSIKWFVDDFNYHTVNLGQQNGEWVFNHPFYIILNVAVGGNWVGPPDASTVFPQTMLVDWVRVYREEF